MKFRRTQSYVRSPLWLVLSVVAGVSLIVVPGAWAGHVTEGADVKVIHDNNNVDGGTPNPGFDAQNRPQNETTVAYSPINPNIVAIGANDYRMVPVFGDAWLGVYVSGDGGATWFNTFVPGFPSDTSPAGLASPLLGLDAGSDPVVRFDGAGNLYLAGIAFNRDFDQEDRPVDNVVYVARYDYTPGTPGGVSTPNAAANPPNFTYAGTTVVGRGAAGAVPGTIGDTGRFVDKEWMEIDQNSGNVYVAYTDFRGVFGSAPIKFSRSTDGGATFSHSKTVTTGGQAGSVFTQGSDIAVASDGTIYIAYVSYDTFPVSISLVKSTDFGKHWSQPVLVGSVGIAFPPPAGVAFRLPTFAFVATDDVDPNIVYVTYQSFVVGVGRIYVQRSTDAGATWGAPQQVSAGAAARHQVFPTIAVSNSALHVAWYDLRNSVTTQSEALDVYYACTNCDGNVYPDFSHSTRVTDVSHNANSLMFGNGTAAFHGDYIELAAYFDGASHIVHLAWADNRDVSPLDFDPAPGPAPNNTGNRNQNIHADMLIVAP